MEYAKEPRNTVRRGARKAHYDEKTIHAILDASDLCHIAFMVEGVPCVQPINYGRCGNKLYIHGSPKNRMTHALIDAGSVSLSVARVDAMKFTKSAMNHSVNFRSAVIFGKVRELTDDAEKLAGLKALINHFVPNRWQYCRPPTDKELLATRVLEITIESASAKVAEGPAQDKPEDMDLDYWTGLVPIQNVFGPPISLQENEDIPEHMLRFCEEGK